MSFGRVLGNCVAVVFSFFGIAMMLKSDGSVGGGFVFEIIAIAIFIGSNFRSWFAIKGMNWKPAIKPPERKSNLVLEVQYRVGNSGDTEEDEGSWRDDPATNRQKEFAMELGIAWPEGITKGELSDRITAAKRDLKNREKKGEL